ncbi:energy-converting hydrogenase A subunit A EhaA [Methanothermobacter wolfeii]|uniref:Probable [NiFe]-hydrogenase-type-3 Eha complex membrane subunit A n=1 Tax=Methanothermobacter wolfeii TaxID=145261 RepID=A0ABU8TT90_METWO|nr:MULTISPECIES: energy-converting hydrogenase A subunit A EhaA [Methanothermobacter]MDI6701645.1 energy-converting hydrogenase A subunit A EhaA [Methanothermobacter wolfeii]NLM02165.1 energy-converting NiFe hydrogenase A subunit EhaA [Methanothermobacter wolfeii]QHN06259.1 iron hydrogenase [Methanothermobacter sp. THM-1]SCM56911.1 putative [NiFe]-hydrogenase-type-3 Eha complex membrane subunit A [Methanothermobacter wolfeii]
MIIHVTYLSGYAAGAVSSIIISVILGLPLVPERPARHSWTPSAIFPAAVIAAGLMAVCIELGVTGIYGGIDLGIIAGAISALMTRYFLEDIFPRPEDSS